MQNTATDAQELLLCYVTLATLSYDVTYTYSLM